MNAIEFLGEWAVRSSVLIAAGALVLWAARVKDSSIRLAVWVALLFGSLVIPVLTVTLASVPVIVSHEVARPITDFVSTPVAALPTPMSQPKFDWMRAAFILYVAVGFGLLLRLVIGLAMTRRLLRDSRATAKSGIRESDQLSGPVTLGIWRPVIVLPLDWRDWDRARLDAVLAHERSHIARFDPAVQVLSAVHRAALWFSPASWFLHSRIVRVAEEASDDAAMAVTRDRASYAELLLDFMRRGVCNAGVPMARYGRMDMRIRRVLDGKVLSRGLTWRSVGAIVVLGSPLAYVVAMANPQGAGAPVPKVVAVAQVPAQPPVSRPAPVARAQRATGYSTWLGSVTAVTATVTPRVDGQLTSVSFKEGQLVHAGDVIATVELPGLRAQLDDAKHRMQRDYDQLEAAKAKQAPYLPPADVLRQMENEIRADEDQVQEAAFSLDNGQRIIAPITGVAGLRLMEPGNNVRAIDPIVTIAQVQPIAVVFTIPESELPKVRSRMGEGVGPTVEAWNRDSTAKLATGHLTAIDNQIDEKTGTVKLKATFDNKDSALFPNQFVIVRLLVQ